MAESEPGIGKKILSFFIKDADEPAQAVPANIPVTKPENAVKSQAEVPVPTGEVNKKFIEHFAALLEKANMPGPDYFEYKQALQSMDGLGLGVEKQFQAAWASFKAMGGAKETTVLKTSAEQYLTVLGRDRESFLKDVEKTIRDRVGALQEEQKRLEQANAAFLSQIADLQRKIDENKSRLGQIAGDVTEQTARIQSNRESYDMTYARFEEQIKSDLNKINQYLH
ncbi:hypothetical protein [Dyadobacter sandarakinus]|uniref:Uncharacterized protein n=1 Tax=Dyadobacter sandarakinus TaxID=2747268 RepID=A0ABX7I392_9BACT|nr:hypothetical protein [Dyadobacter sandarakinus]QRR00345.1 hypothetical protein HWI92_05200 [Dyadobacter sandarakinus]